MAAELVAEMKIRNLQQGQQLSIVTHNELSRNCPIVAYIILCYHKEVGEPRQQSLRSLSYPTTNAYGYVLISVLTTYRIYATPDSFSLMRGVSGDDPPDGAGRGVPWPTVANRGAGGTGPSRPGLAIGPAGKSQRGSGGHCRS